MYIEYQDGMTDGVMGVNLEPVFPTGATMSDPYTKPRYCGLDVAADGQKTVASCDQERNATSACCCTAAVGALRCHQWSCCAEGRKCTRGKGCSAS
jgi:hypothetical protein